ncbi:MAG: flagellin [Proteobacteria bacterium]|nr:flagellin [Pseudomonadota bacterium]MDE3207647.1 flagellin [Pseudomonadota bacterium]
MSSFINTNINSLIAQQNLNNTQNSLSTALQRLSSGLRINSAADDAAGLAISNGLTAQINGLMQAGQNANNAISVTQTAEGAVSSITNDLQQIRQLAVESANSSNSSLNRSQLQGQVSQLLAEIQRVATTTQFNGVNLLDGTFQNQQFQVGANAGETIGISIASAQTSALGGGSSASVSSRGTTSGAALASGDLIINGVIVGASQASSDSASYSNAADSAIAKAAAINAVSSQTGVTAAAEANTYAGTSMAAGTLGTTGTITINGVAITVALGSNNSSTRASVVAAINAASGQTGVTAADTGSDTTGVTLTAADGRNITVAYSGVTSAQTGVGAAATHYGAYTLTSSSAITLTSSTGNNVNAGLTLGTYQPNTAYVSSAAGTANALASGDVLINGISVGASLATSDTASYANAADSAIAKAAAVNAVSSQTGVTATVNANTLAGGTTTAASATHTGTIVINGVATAQVSVVAGETTAEQRAAVVSAINAISGQTGVTATDTQSNTTGVTLTAADGRNITIKNGTGSTLTAADVGLSGLTSSNVTTEGSFTLSSAGKIQITAGTNNASTDFGVDAGTYGSSRSGQAISSLDISTASGANAAIVAVDNALSSINSLNAQLGAFQNRFTAAISDLQSTQTNLTSARSQIMDANFAVETANLSRAQILQQAGTAMLAQANALPQSVLKLLQ